MWDSLPSVEMMTHFACSVLFLCCTTWMSAPDMFRHIMKHFLMDNQKLIKKWIHLLMHDQEPPYYVHDLINKINHIFGIPYSYQRVSWLDIVRHMGQKFSKQFIWPTHCVCEKTLILLFCPLSVRTAAEALIRQASDALCSIFQRVIVRYHWGIDKYESNRV